MVNKPNPRKYYLDFFDEPICPGFSLGFSAAFCLELFDKFGQRTSPLFIYLVIFPLGIIFSTSLIVTSWAFFDRRYWQLAAATSLLSVSTIMMLDRLIPF